MGNKIIISENKNLEHNEKCYRDTLQLFGKLNEDNIDKLVSKIIDNKELKEMLPSIHFDKGQTIWLELKVEDSFLSSMIYSWMYSKSNHDNINGLQALGCSLQSIMLSKPSGYTDEQKNAIKCLYESAFGL